jgi:RNA polymerase sigma factor (sigma-70 family)
MANHLDEKNTLSEYMRAVGATPLLTHEEELACSRTILDCKTALIDGIVSSEAGRQAVVALFKKVQDGTLRLTYTLKKEDYSDDDPKKDRTRTLKLFDAFYKIYTHKYKSEKYRNNKLALVLKRINLGVEAIKLLSTDTVLLNRLVTAQNKLIEANLRLVMTVVRGFIGFGVPFEDLVQEGNLGLMRATEDFDYKCGNKFSTYAYGWIRQKISRCLMTSGRLIRLPANMGVALGSISETIKTLFIQNKRKPTKAEIAAALGISIEKLDGLILMSYSPMSLDSPLYNSQDSEDQFAHDMKVGDAVKGDDEFDTERMCEISASREKLNEAISKVLTPREEKIIRLHFGIYPEQGEKTYKEIAKVVGITKQGVQKSVEGSSSNKGSLGKLKAYFKEERLTISVRRTNAREKKKAGRGGID